MFHVSSTRCTACLRCTALANCSSGRGDRMKRAVWPWSGLFSCCKCCSIMLQTGMTSGHSVLRRN